MTTCVHKNNIYQYKVCDKNKNKYTQLYIHFCDHIISLRGEVWVHNTSLMLPLIEMPVCVCVCALGVSIFASVSTIFQLDF